MKVKYLLFARDELTEAIRHYNRKKKGLGKELQEEDKQAEQRIINHPNSGHLLLPEIRRCMLKRFPYGLIFGLAGDAIWILAVMHLHRDPNYWKDRLADAGFSEPLDT